MRARSMIVFSLMAAACAPSDPASTVAFAPAVLSAAALDSVKAVDAAFAAGMNTQDTAAVFAVYATDAKVMPPDSPVLEGAAIRAMITGMMASGASDLVLTQTSAYGVGDLAYMLGTVSFKAGGVSETVKFTEVLRRGTDGKWRYVVDMFSGITPPAAAAPAPAK